MRRALLLCLCLPALGACSRAAADTAPGTSTPSAVPAAIVAVPASVAAPASASPAAEPTFLAPHVDPPGQGHAFSTKSYQRVLQTGDSMVGGGLCRALAPRFAKEGTKLVRDVWESGSIEGFAESDRISSLIAHHQPDLVLLNLGANDVGGNVSPYLAKKIAKVVARTQEGGPRDCVWIGPPKWKVDGAPVVDLIKEHVAPCVFFDSTDIEMHRKPDKIHPDEKGGDEWAIAFWRFFRGPDADAGSFDVARGILR